MRLLQLGIRVGNQRARFAQAEAELTEHPLALAHAQPNPIVPCQPDLQRFPVPQCPAQADLARRTSQYRFNLLPLCRTQPFGSPDWRPFDQPGETALFKMPHPVFHRAWGGTQQSTNLGQVIP